MAWICLLAARMPGDGLGDCDEAVGWFYQGWIFRSDCGGYGCQRLALGPGGEDLAHGDSVRRLDRNWRRVRWCWEL